MRYRCWMSRAAALAGIAIVLGTAGCARPEIEQPGPATPPADPPSSVPALAPPGLYELDDGRTQVIGLLAYRDLEGGFYAVVDAYPGDDAHVADVLAVIANAAELATDIDDFVGRYVIATGELAEGASIRQAGPELVADAVEPVEETIVAPGDDPAEGTDN